MSWFKKFIPESIKKNVCSCLIKRYLSHFIENEITRDQLSVDLYNGRATAERITLAVEALNALGEDQNWPIEFIDGYIEKIQIYVPWSSIFSDSVQVEISGLKLTVQPKQQKEDASSMFESMWNSMTSSVRLAEEFTKDSKNNRESNNSTIGGGGGGIEGVKLFAETIDTVVRRIKVKLIDSIIQIEHLPKDCVKGVGLVLNIDLLEYFDDFSVESDEDDNHDTLDPSKAKSKKAFLVDATTTKNILLKGVQLSSVEFSSTDRTVSHSLIREDANEDFEDATPTIEKSVEHDDDLRYIIPFGKCFNSQEVKIRLKQSENCTGPKVEIEINLGTLILFLSPRQFHILIELINGFSSPDLQDNSNILNKNQPRTRPMNEKDYAIVEEQLAQMCRGRNYTGFNLMQTHGWATGSSMEYEDDSEYIPCPGLGNLEMFDSTMSGASSSLDSSMTSSSMVSSANTDNTRRKASNLNSDPTAEISHFQVRISTLAVVLSHEDSLIETVMNKKLVVQQMIRNAEKFFENIDKNIFSNLVADGFEQVHQNLENACSALKSFNHLRLLASPIRIDGNETTTSSAFSITGNFTASKLELSECLYSSSQNSGAKRFKLLNFDVSQNVNISSNSKPNVNLKFKHVQRLGKSLEKGRGPKTEITLHLDKCSVEFDLSIIDRIPALLFHPKICTATRNNEELFWANKQVPINLRENFFKSVQEFKVLCLLMRFKLCFPIPDFLPNSCNTKPFWWDKHIRSDYLTLILHNCNFFTIFQTGQLFNEFNIESSLLDIFYFESENSNGIHIGRSGKEDSSSENSVRFSFKLYPKKEDEAQTRKIDPMTHSCYGAFENQNNPDSGPFMGKKVVHESDTPHEHAKKDESEEQVIPGDRSEIKEFIEEATSNVQMLIELTLPQISAQLESKHIYELIYNRINNDLLLWKSQAPKYNSKLPYADISKIPYEEQFILANKGTTGNDSESDDDDADVESNVYYSTYESKSRSTTLIHDNAVRTNDQSEFALILNIPDGVLSLFPAVKDSTGNIIPEQKGQVLISVSNANVCVISGYKNDENLSYVCVQVNNAQLFHCDILPEGSNRQLREFNAPKESYLLPTIYQLDATNLSNLKTVDISNREMFTVALKIQANHETHHAKVITVSLGLNQAILRHKMGQHSNSWIAHLIDYFNAQDYPIPFYRPKEVLTELHLHIWNCAVDYRPLHLPIRSVITIGNFSISSHLTAIATTSTLTMIFQDCGLFLSDKYPSKNSVASAVKLDIKRDFVNVVSITLFEISVKTTDKHSGINPHIDLRTSINLLNIRTCSDSGRALFELLTYFINDGDLNLPQVEVPESAKSSPARSMEDELIAIDGDVNYLSKTQQEHITELLQEAMEESPKANKTQSINKEAGAQLFYFPDEIQVEEMNAKDVPTDQIPLIDTDLGNVNMYHFSNDESPITTKTKNEDEGFVLIGEETMLPKNVSSEITWLCQDVNFVENYFAKPDGKRDVLAAPKKFGTPTHRYVLCEMTIIWEMYGGNDFAKKVVDDGSVKNKKGVQFADQTLGNVVTFSNNRESKIEFKKSSGTSSTDWIKKGGVNRDHTVLMELQFSKVKFSHEVYPDANEQASRQVLCINDVEIRDRLESSQINKFLYQYSSHSLPKQSNSNMLVIKALHSRPDPKLKREECDVRITLLPIRLNIDQDSLFFLINFIRELSGISEESTAESRRDSSSSTHTSPTHHPPIMTTSFESEGEIKQKAKNAVAENLILLESRYNNSNSEEQEQEEEEEVQEQNNSSNVADDSPIYFRQVEFSREVLIRLDYVGKKVDFSHGPIAGLLIGLTYLKCSEIRLKRIVHRHGLLGFSKLFSFLLQQWITDIKTNQLSTILAGAGPMKAVIQLCEGIRDLFWLPIQQYQRDGRIIRGLQRGANSFTTSTAMAALELTSKLLYIIQITAETAYDMLSPGPSLRMKRRAKKKRYNQPQDIREGVTNAITVFKDGIGETAVNIMEIVSQEKEQKGYSGAVGAVIRQIPPTIVKPIIISLDATNNVVGGMQSQLVPDVRKEANEKWFTDL